MRNVTGGLRRVKIHMVKKGDTLYEIAQKHGVSLEDLIKLNPEIANPDAIDVGMKVKIPSGQTNPGVPAQDWYHQHVVKQGDSLWKLSKAWGIPLNEMIKANPQLKNPNALLTGEVVNIPKSGTGQPMGEAHIPEEAGMPYGTHQYTQQALEGGKIPTAPIEGGKIPTGPIAAGKVPTAPIEGKKPSTAVIPLQPPAPAPVQEISNNYVVPIHIEYEKHIDMFQKVEQPPVEAPIHYEMPHHMPEIHHHMPVMPLPVVQPIYHYPVYHHYPFQPCPEYLLPCDYDLHNAPGYNWNAPYSGIENAAWPCPPDMMPYPFYPNAAMPYESPNLPPNLPPWYENNMPGMASPAMPPVNPDSGTMSPLYGYGQMPGMPSAAQGMPAPVGPGSGMPYPPAYGYGGQPQTGYTGMPPEMSIDGAQGMSPPVGAPGMPGWGPMYDPSAYAPMGQMGGYPGLEIPGAQAGLMGANRYAYAIPGYTNFQYGVQHTSGKPCNCGAAEQMSPEQTVGDIAAGQTVTTTEASAPPGSRRTVNKASFRTVSKKSVRPKRRNSSSLPWINR
jgi:morphogenetic protein associated with SpoVID